MGKIERTNKKAKNMINKKAIIDVKRIKREIKEDIHSNINRQGKKDIKKSSYKRYDEIYLLYGKQSYLKYVPKSIRKKDLEELYQEGRFITIYEKHGEEAFQKKEINIMSEDIEYETGSKIKGNFFNFRKSIAKETKKLLATVTGVLIGGNVVLLGTIDDMKEKSIKENVIEISEYIDSIKEYASEIKDMKLTDTEIIMKVMNDMWNSIDGYGEPQKDLIGCLGLDMSTENGVGVCRNMADDCARKLNEINPEYNARIIAVEMTANPKNVEFANIEISRVQNDLEEEEEKVLLDTTGKKIKYTLIGMVNEIIEKNTGNHAVILMDIPKDNVTLIVDPTNPSIGIYKDGKIKMFNSKTDNGIEIERKIFGEEILCGLDVQNFPKEYFQSFLSCDLSDEELEQKYGVEAQNKALTKVRLEDENNFMNVIKQYYYDKGVNVEEQLKEQENNSYQDNNKEDER